jgi:signal transduction histidine kinase
VKNHGGDIEVSSVEGEGTVLLVDDEAMVLSVGEILKG